MNDLMNDRTGGMRSERSEERRVEEDWKTEELKLMMEN
jgi:hypothetical protein